MTEATRVESKLRVVIADDEPRARQFLEKLLAEHPGVEIVGAARGGAEAIEKIGTTRPDVAFLDIHMPDLSGLEVARHLKSDAMPVVVFVTAYDQYAVEAFEVAAVDYLLKPIRRERLAETLRRVAQEPRGARAIAQRAAAVETALDQPGLKDRMPVLKRLPVRH
ncbi:MAG TPA: response regulator, partial [Candidatus Udaeobacter sp.]|nr:response regulator [Candidatus Udaeobacter sp.]